MWNSSSKKWTWILNSLWWTDFPIRYGYDEYSYSFSNCFYYVYSCCKIRRNFKENKLTS